MRIIKRKPRLTAEAIERVAEAKKRAADDKWHEDFHAFHEQLRERRNAEAKERELSRAEVDERERLEAAEFLQKKIPLVICVVVAPFILAIVMIICIAKYQ